jgi:hypothetical protein
VALHGELRALEAPELVDGVADWSPGKVVARREGLARLRARLGALAVASWPRPQQVDWLLVRSAVDGADFTLAVLKPWARDPGSSVDPLLYLAFTQLPQEGEGLEKLRARLRLVPRQLTAARGHLTEAAGELADLALYNLERPDGVGHGHPRRPTPPAGVLGWYDDLLARAKRLQPELVPEVEAARAAVDGYRMWLRESRPTMTARAGIGQARLDWYLRNVKLMPYTSAQLLVLGDREYQRTAAALALEQHRNRKLPPLTPARSEAEYKARIAEADRDVRRFLRQQDILTVPADVGVLDTNVPWTVRPGGRNFWEEVQFRDPRPDHVHAVIPGHRFDGVMAERLKHPIRSRFADSARVEGWANYLEEALMVAGLLDTKPRTRELFHLFGVKRAVRIRADIQMQLNQMSVSDAVAYMRERTPFLDQAVARVDAEIYLRRPPGYGLSYNVGKIQLEALLADRARQLGGDLTLKRFHDELLATGRIPLSLVRWELTGLTDEVAPLFKSESMP